MMRFYEMFKTITIIPQIGEQTLEKFGDEIVPQVGEQFEMASNRVFMIPWKHRAVY
jgi:hypothetical protein